MRILPVIGVIVLSFCALADDGHDNNNNSNSQKSSSSFETGVVGSTPGQTIGGVVSGGAPWVVGRGETSVSADGRIRVEVEGLLIGQGGPSALVGTTGPVSMVAATLVCGGSGGAGVVVPDATVTPSPLSSSGGAEIRQSITLPAACIAPVVLIRIFNPAAALGSQLGPFIAASGISPAAMENQNQNGGDHNGGHDGY